MATPPRCLIAGTTYMVTRRCAQREFLLRPSKFLNHSFCFILAYTATKYPVSIHAACVLSNHFHIVVTDPDQNLSKFMGLLDSLLSRFLNAYYGRSESLFSQPESFNAVQLVDPDAVLEKIVYVLTNPVAAGLVFCGSRWPGVRLSHRRIDRPRNIQRPKFFFREGGPVPALVTLEITKPPAFLELDDSEYLGQVDAAVAEKEEEVQKLFAEQERRFLGEKRVLKQSLSTRPSTPRARKEISPHVACRDPVLRKLALQARKRFLEEYRAALREFCQLLRKRSRQAYEVVFPCGTYWMRERYGVCCAVPPVPT